MGILRRHFDLHARLIKIAMFRSALQRIGGSVAQVAKSNTGRVSTVRCMGGGPVKNDGPVFNPIAEMSDADLVKCLHDPSTRCHQGCYACLQSCQRILHRCAIPRSHPVEVWSPEEGHLALSPEGDPAYS